MTQSSRTTETINRDNAAIRDIMHQVLELTVPDRATLTLGLVGHLATMMNRSQMKKLMDQLREEAERVQDVPPSRQQEDEEGGNADPRTSAEAVKVDSAANSDSRVSAAGAVSVASSDRSRGAVRGAGRGRDRDARATAREGVQPADPERTAPTGDVLREQVRERVDGAARQGGRSGINQAGRDGAGESAHDGVGQGGRGEFRSSGLL